MRTVGLLEELVPSVLLSPGSVAVEVAELHEGYVIDVLGMFFHLFLLFCPLVYPIFSVQLLCMVGDGFFTSCQLGGELLQCSLHPLHVRGLQLVLRKAHPDLSVVAILGLPRDCGLLVVVGDTQVVIAEW